MPCYCGSELSFEQCCKLIIQGDINAKTPEQLMRSRYSAYATKQVDHIFNTYAKDSKANQSVEDIKHWAEQTVWLKLNIVNTDNIEKHQYEFFINNDSLPVVEFFALYIHDKKFHKMSEKSRFTLENNQWRYLDGDVAEHQVLTTPKRNEACICQSNIKFKSCCALKL